LSEFSACNENAQKALLLLLLLLLHGKLTKTGLRHGGILNGWTVFAGSILGR
jgi:hypothetical protein